MMMMRTLPNDAGSKSDILKHAYANVGPCRQVSKAHDEMIHYPLWNMRGLNRLATKFLTGT
jgi:hypothetical protein